MDWSLLGCGRGGHVTYAPDEPALRSQLTARTASGEAWRCLRCGTFVTGPPGGRGPAAAAPAVRRGKELRSAFILRIFAVERFGRALVFGAAAFGVWRLEYARTSLERAFDRALPDVRRLYTDLGFNFSQSKLVGLVNHALELHARTLGYLAIGLAAYGVIEIIEGIGLWLLKRWGEYFAMVATSIFLPYEIYDLTVKLTGLRVLTFLVNLALVVYLVISKRLFGVRGGKKAYDVRLREDSILGAAAEAAAAAEAPAGAETPAGAEAAAAAPDHHPAGHPDPPERPVGPSLPAGQPDPPERRVGPSLPVGDPAGAAGGGAPGPDDSVTAERGAPGPPA